MLRIHDIITTKSKRYTLAALCAVFDFVIHEFRIGKPALLCCEFMILY